MIILAMTLWSHFVYAQYLAILKKIVSKLCEVLSSYIGVPHKPVFFLYSRGGIPDNCNN